MPALEADHADDVRRLSDLTVCRWRWRAGACATFFPAPASASIQSRDTLQTLYAAQHRLLTFAAMSPKTVHRTMQLARPARLARDAPGAVAGCHRGRASWLHGDLAGAARAVPAAHDVRRAAASRSDSSKDRSAATTSTARRRSPVGFVEGVYVVPAVAPQGRRRASCTTPSATGRRHAAAASWPPTRWSTTK